MNMIDHWALNANRAEREDEARWRREEKEKTISDLRDWIANRGDVTLGDVFGSLGAQHIVVDSLVIGAFLIVGCAVGKSAYNGHQNILANKDIVSMIAGASSSGALQFKALVDGRMVNLSALSPEERVLKLLDVGKRYTAENSNKVTISVSDAQGKLICPIEVNVTSLQNIVAMQKLPEFTAEQATKYAKSLQKMCYISPDNAKRLEESLLSGIQKTAAASPYSAVTDGVIHASIDPKAITRGK
jgi:hypothetical protein